VRAASPPLSAAEADTSLIDLSQGVWLFLQENNSGKGFSAAEILDKPSKEQPK
jgi:hypothetical protein